MSSIGGPVAVCKLAASPSALLDRNWGNVDLIRHANVDHSRTMNKKLNLNMSRILDVAHCIIRHPRRPLGLVVAKVGFV